MRAELDRLRRVLLAARSAWSILGLTLALLLVAELALRAMFAAKDAAFPVPLLDRRVIREGYGDAPWARASIRELESVESMWEPYVYFRQKPMNGRFIRIDAQGIRATWHDPSSTDPAKEIDILCLGGSSLWGFGARDDETIPSLLARELAARGLKGRVRNLAQLGYVNTQEVVALVRALQAGERPRVVVFYDGVNDTTSAFLNREAGLPENEENRRVEFNLRQQPARLLGVLVSRLVADSALFRLAKSAARRLVRTDREGPGAGLPPLSEADERRLADEVVRRYAENLRMIEALGREYGFHPLFYWQPVVFTKVRRTPPEDDEVKKYAWIDHFFREVYGRIERSSTLKDNRDFRDVSQIFGSSPMLELIDYCHTTEAANARIAKVIAEDIAVIEGTNAK